MSPDRKRKWLRGRLDESLHLSACIAFLEPKLLKSAAFPRVAPFVEVRVRHSMDRLANRPPPGCLSLVPSGGVLEAFTCVQQHRTCEASLSMHDVM